MQKTKNLELNKPDYEDLADIAPINDNMEILDREVANKSDLGHTHTELPSLRRDVTIEDIANAKYPKSYITITNDFKDDKDNDFKILNDLLGKNDIRNSYESPCGDSKPYLLVYYHYGSDFSPFGIQVAIPTGYTYPYEENKGVMPVFIRKCTAVKEVVSLNLNDDDDYMLSRSISDIINKYGFWEEYSGQTKRVYIYDWSEWTEINNSSGITQNDIFVKDENYSITKTFNTLDSFIKDIYTRLLKVESISVNGKGKSTSNYAEYAWDANKLNGKSYNSYVTNRVYHSSLDLNNPSFDKAYITVTTDTSIIPNNTEGSSGYWHLMHLPYSNGCSTQFAMPFGTNKVYTRSSKNNVWSDWVSLLTSEGGTILYDDEDVVKKVDLSDSGVCITNSNYSPSFVAYHDNEYGSSYKGNKINIADNEISVYEESRYNDENGDYENKITINSDTIKYEGDYNGYLRGFIVEGYERVRNVTMAVDWNTLNATGFYHIRTQEGINRPVTHHGLLYVDETVETPFQIFIPDGSTGGIYKRSLNSDTWINIIESLPANGGNADMVDGKHASDLQNYDNLINRPVSLKNPYSLTIQGNGTVLADGTYDGSVSKIVNITPSAIGALPYMVISNGDFNEVKTPGIYTMRNCSNPPATGNYWGLFVLKSDTGESYFQQIAFKESSEEIWIRKNGSNVWRKLGFSPIIQEESSANLTTINSSLADGDILMLYS